jgi:hypothetical protein
MVDTRPAEMSTTCYSVGEPLSDRVGKIIVGEEVPQDLFVHTHRRDVRGRYFPFDAQGYDSAV